MKERRVGPQPGQVPQPPAAAQERFRGGPQGSPPSGAAAQDERALRERRGGGPQAGPPGGPQGPTPQDGYIVYYDGWGRPFYYNGGASYYVPQSSPYYASYVGHYRTYGAAYRGWYARGGYRAPMYRGRGLALPADNTDDVERYRRQVADAAVR